jgi:hypothetical protein
MTDKELVKLNERLDVIDKVSGQLDELLRILTPQPVEPSVSELMEKDNGDGIAALIYVMEQKADEG